MFMGRTGCSCLAEYSNVRKLCTYIACKSLVDTGHQSHCFSLPWLSLCWTWYPSRAHYLQHYVPWSALEYVRSHIQPHLGPWNSQIMFICHFPVPFSATVARLLLEWFQLVWMVMHFPAGSSTMALYLEHASVWLYRQPCHSQMHKKSCCNI